MEDARAPSSSAFIVVPERGVTEVARRTGAACGPTAELSHRMFFLSSLNADALGGRVHLTEPVHLCDLAFGFVPRSAHVIRL